jgi:hypothetical protein
MVNGGSRPDTTTVVASLRHTSEASNVLGSVRYAIRPGPGSSVGNAAALSPRGELQQRG